jgi:hypothetical protein
MPDESASRTKSSTSSQTDQQEVSLEVMLQRVRAMREKDRPARGKSKYPGLQGIKPRNFRWIIKGQLAGSERPGGATKRHRRVRRDEELIWIAESEIAEILSLLPSTLNMKAYADFGIPARNIPVTSFGELRAKLPEIYQAIDEARRAGRPLLVHMDEFSDTLAGLLAGYLIHAGLVRTPQEATILMERIVQRPLGPDAKIITRDAALLETRPQKGRSSA